MPDFNFGSIADFFAMGGYALFVWLSFGVSAFLLLMLGIASQRAQQQFLNELAKAQAREQRVKAHQQESV